MHRLDDVCPWVRLCVSATSRRSNIIFTLLIVRGFERNDMRRLLCRTEHGGWASCYLCLVNTGVCSVGTHIVEFHFSRKIEPYSKTEIKYVFSPGTKIMNPRQYFQSFPIRRSSVRDNVGRFRKTRKTNFRSRFANLLKVSSKLRDRDSREHAFRVWLSPLLKTEMPGRSASGKQTVQDRCRLQTEGHGYRFQRGMYEALWNVPCTLCRIALVCERRLCTVAYTVTCGIDERVCKITSCSPRRYRLRTWHTSKVS